MLVVSEVCAGGCEVGRVGEERPRGEERGCGLICNRYRRESGGRSRRKQLGIGGQAATNAIPCISKCSASVNDGRNPCPPINPVCASPPPQNR